MNTQTKQILISVGEASGDLHAANLVRSVHAINPNIQFLGMGGKLMEAAGVKLLVDSTTMSFMFGFEILANLHKIWQARQTLKKFLFENKPDLLILVDYPGFNLRLAKIAKAAGVKVLYYISPKIWAWNQGRIKIIKKYVDLMAVIFPFEVEFYHQFQMPAAFVGNPLVNIAKSNLNREQAVQKFALDPKKQIIGLFPGSRQSEIRRLLPIILQTALLLKTQHPELQFILPIANSITPETIQKHLTTTNLKVTLIKEQIYDVIRACDAIIAASGTVTMEIALVGTPLVVIYKTSWFEYQVAKRVIKIPYVSLCNILAKKKIVQELLQYDATPENIAQEITRLLNDHEYRSAMIDKLREMKDLLLNNQQQQLAKLILQLAELNTNLKN